MIYLKPLAVELTLKLRSGMNVLVKRTWLVTVILMGILLISLFLWPDAIRAADNPNANDDPWGRKEVLNYLFWTDDPKLESDVKQLQQDLALTDDEMTAIKEIALREHQMVVSMRQTANNSDEFNQAADRALLSVDREIQDLLGPKYGPFRQWIQRWWNDERQYRQEWLSQQRLQARAGNDDLGILANTDRELVFATQYDGYTNNEVALPDKYLKFANLGWPIPDPFKQRYNNPPYTVNVFYEKTNKAVLDVPVKEVGPWNEDDNYWDSKDGANPRRLFNDLALGTPEAEAAFLTNYNGGKDQFGRTVKNPAGIDLTPEVAAQLGLKFLENAWVWVRYSDLP